MKGTCKWFNASKGFGFVTTEEGVDAFVHYSALQMDGYKELKENQKVTFDLEDSPKGKKAVNVKLDS